MSERVIKSIDGRRGSFLLFGGLAYLFVGISQVSMISADRESAFSWLPDFMTPHNLGWLWIAAGLVVAIVPLFSRRFVKQEPLAFALLALCPGMWVGVYAGAFLTGAHPGGWVTAVIYALMAGWVWVASDWENPATPITVEVTTGEVGRAGNE